MPRPGARCAVQPIGNDGLDAFAAPQLFQQGLVNETVLWPAELLLEPARRLAALEAQHAVDRAHLVAARLQQSLDFLPLIQAEQRLLDRPLPDDAPAAEDTVAKIGDRQRVRGR